MSDLEDTAASLGKSPKAATKAVGIDKADYVRIQLNEDAENIPPTGLPVGVNGKCYLIRAGTPVDVPPSVVEVLDHAIVQVPYKDPSTLKVTGYRSRLRFPYQRLSKEAA